MKFIFCAFVFAMLLTGCNQKPDPRVDKLEKRIVELENNHSNVVDVVNRMTDLVVTNCLATADDMAKLQKLLSQQSENYLTCIALLTNKLATMSETKPTNRVISAGGLSIDFETGLPTGSSPHGNSIRVTKTANRVTEQNSIYWRWSYNFTIANPWTTPSTVDVSVKFFDAGNFLIESKNEYDLTVPANSSGNFSGYALINSSKARNVKFFTVEIKK